MRKKIIHSDYLHRISTIRLQIEKGEYLKKKV